MKTKHVLTKCRSQRKLLSEGDSIKKASRATGFSEKQIERFKSSK